MSMQRSRNRAPCYSMHIPGYMMDADNRHEEVCGITQIVRQDYNSTSLARAGNKDANPPHRLTSDHCTSRVWPSFEIGSARVNTIIASDRFPLSAMGTG